MKNFLMLILAVIFSAPAYSQDCPDCAAIVVSRPMVIKTRQVIRSAPCEVRLVERQVIRAVPVQARVVQTEVVPVAEPVCLECVQSYGELPRRRFRERRLRVFNWGCLGAAITAGFEAYNNCAVQRRQYRRSLRRQ